MRPSNCLNLFLFLAAFSAFAGSDTRDCETPDGVIAMGVGTHSTYTLQIKTTAPDGTQGVYEVPVSLCPDCGDADQDQETITAIPISSEIMVSRNHQRMHVRHVDGTECYGRESWDDQSRQSYILTGNNGDPLRHRRSALENQEIGYWTDAGYLLAEFSCRSYGVSSPGGCRVEDPQDTVTWEPSND